MSTSVTACTECEFYTYTNDIFSFVSRQIKKTKFGLKFKTNPLVSRSEMTFGGSYIFKENRQNCDL